MNYPGLKIVFVAVIVVNIQAEVELSNLLGQLWTSDLSILLLPKQWFEGEKGDSNISNLPFSCFPVGAKIMVWVSLFRPKNSIWWDGSRTEFFRFMIKLRC